MRLPQFLLFLVFAALVACNNEETGSISEADSINRAQNREADTIGGYRADRATAELLANAVGTELFLLEIHKQTSGFSPSQYQSAIDSAVQIHETALGRLREMAAERNIALPLAPDKEKTEMLLQMKTNTSASAKKYGELALTVLEELHSIYNDGMNNSKDAEVKTFSSDMMPKLQLQQLSIKDALKSS